MLGVPMSSTISPCGHFIRDNTLFRDQFYLELEDGQHVLIIRDPTVKRGLFRG